MLPSSIDRVTEVQTSGEVNLVGGTVMPDEDLAVFRKMMNIPEDRILISGGEGDRASNSDKGLCLYWRMPSWGMTFPLSDFKKQVLLVLNCPPAQVSGMAWCYLCSFEKLFETHSQQFADCPLKSPTLGVCLFYFGFFREKSYISVRNRDPKRKLFHLTKVEKDFSKFFFLALQDSDSEWSSWVNPVWQLSVKLPCRVFLTTKEKCVVALLEQLRGMFRFIKLVF